jgi:hypothetical protein
MMKRLCAATLIISGWLAVFMAGCGPDSSGRVSIPVVPDTGKVSPAETLSFAANAKGVQIYECRGWGHGSYSDRIDSATRSVAVQGPASVGRSEALDQMLTYAALRRHFV